MNFKEMMDMAKLANEARKLQKEQEKIQRYQIELLEKIYHTLQDILKEIKSK